MLAIDIPGFGALRLEHLVLDFNGTLAVDGILLHGVKPMLRALSTSLELHVATADTFGSAARELVELPVAVVTLSAHGQAAAKAELVRRLGAERVAAIGNGRNDREMLRTAALGIAVVQREGAATQAICAADAIASSIVDALELLLEPRRLVATLRD